MATTQNVYVTGLTMAHLFGSFLNFIGMIVAESSGMFANSRLNWYFSILYWVIGVTFGYCFISNIVKQYRQLLVSIFTMTIVFATLDLSQSIDIARLTSTFLNNGSVLVGGAVTKAVALFLINISLLLILCIIGSDETSVFNRACQYNMNNGADVHDPIPVNVLRERQPSNQPVVVVAN